MLSTIQDGQSITVFAPNNDALSGLDVEGLEASQIADLLSYHVSTFDLPADDIDLTTPLFVPTFYTPSGGASGTSAPGVGYVEDQDGLQIQSGLAQRVTVDEGVSIVAISDCLVHRLT